MPLSSMGGGWGPLEKVFKGGSYNDVIEILKNDYKYSDPTYLVTYIDNHDKPRFNGSEEEYIDALNFYFTVRGIPCVFYGNEISMEGGEDPDNRRYFGVESIAKAKKSKIYSHIKKLNALRKKSNALKKGKQFNIFASKDQFVFKRIYNEEIVYVYLNKSDKDVVIGSFLSDGVYEDIFSNRRIEIRNREIIIKPHSLKVIKLKI